jgi:hypothetical protein
MSCCCCCSACCVGAQMYVLLALLEMRMLVVGMQA